MWKYERQKAKDTMTNNRADTYMHLCLACMTIILVISIIIQNWFIFSMVCLSFLFLIMSLYRVSVYNEVPWMKQNDKRRKK